MKKRFGGSVAYILYEHAVPRRTKHICGSGHKTLVPPHFPCWRWAIALRFARLFQPTQREGRQGVVELAAMMPCRPR